MPTVLRVDGFRFFFFSAAAARACREGGGAAKIWLQPVRVAYSYGLTPAEIRRIRELTFEHQAIFVERWNEHFGR